MTSGKKQKALVLLAFGAACAYGSHAAAERADDLGQFYPKAQDCIAQEACSADARVQAESYIDARSSWTFRAGVAGLFGLAAVAGGIGLALEAAAEKKRNALPLPLALRRKS